MVPSSSRSGRRSSVSVLAVVAVAIGALAAGCSSDSNGAAAATDAGAVAATDPDAVGATDPGAVFGDVDGAGDSPDVLATAPLPPDEAQVSDSVLNPIEPVPDTGVPGIDSSDRFCRSWSEFAGSYQALAFQWSIDPQRAPGLEVVAAPAVVAAATTMAATVPDALTDGANLVGELTGPLARRAERSVSALRDDGLDEAMLAATATAWIDTLRDRGLYDEQLAVAAPDGTAGAIDAVTSELAASLPPFSEDPSLIVAADVTPLETYLVDNCPDQGTLLGNDGVG